MAYYFGGKQYAKDTALSKNGKFIFTGDEKLDGGRIISQKSFYIMVNSNVSDLKKRTQNLEYSAYPESLIKIFRASY